MKPLHLLRLLLLLPLLLVFTHASHSQVDPPGRVAAVTQRLGTVVFAPAGEREWTDLPLNRPLTRTDRVWTDVNARAELHLGTATLHLDSRTLLEIAQLDHDAVHVGVAEGVLNLRARALTPGESLRVDTPHLAVQALQPGDWRVEVDPATQLTVVTVRSGAVSLHGRGGQRLQMAAGQHAAFTGGDLQQVQAPRHRPDAFDQWAEARNLQEDRAQAAFHLPREVIGYQQLEGHGEWRQDPTHGPVWFPYVSSPQWAPYRHGQWSWIAPWGWTWIDESPWGFAPFHYGRWAQFGSRWAWVPGAIGPRPVYSPALVVFVGGTADGGRFALSVGSGPGVAWYPLAPGEYWRPGYLSLIHI